MRQRQPDARIVLALGFLLSAIVVVLPLASRPRYVLVGAGLDLVAFALLRMIGSDEYRRR